MCTCVHVYAVCVCGGLVCSIPYCIMHVLSVPPYAYRPRCGDGDFGCI